MTTKPTLDWTAIEADVRTAVDCEYGPPRPEQISFVKVNYIADRVLNNKKIYPSFKNCEPRTARVWIGIVFQDRIKWERFAKARGRRGSAIYIRPSLVMG